MAGCNGIKDESWRDWTPIGDGYNGYKGTFDGQEHNDFWTVPLCGECNPDEDQYDGEDVGIVRKLNNSGIIQNIGLENLIFMEKQRLPVFVVEIVVELSAIVITP